MRRQVMRKRLGTAAFGLVIMLLLAGCLGGGGSPAPKLAVDQTSLDFGADRSMMSFQIKNTGGGRLEWNVSSDQDWLHVQPMSGENAGTVTVLVERSVLDPGEHGGLLAISSNGGTASIAVSVAVSEAPVPPKLEVSTASLDFGTDHDELSFRIDNAGGGVLSWMVTAAQPWINVQPTSGENTAVVTVSVDRSSLEPRAYIGTVSVASNGGMESIVVAMTVVPEEEPPPPEPPGQVQGLDARGFTMPVGTAPMSMDAYSASARAQSLLELVKDFEFAPAGAGGAGPATVQRAAMPAGYTAAWVLSWDPEDDATAYRISMDAGHGAQSMDVSVDDLEDPFAPTFMISGNFDVGATATFSVHAMKDDLVGPASEEDGAVIIAPQKLMTPGNGTGAPAQPTFMWEAHADATAYMLFLTQDDPSNHVWTQVLNGDVTVREYPGDAANAPHQLEAGDYGWFVTAQGPIDGNGHADAYSISQTWTFSVGE